MYSLPAQPQLLLSHAPQADAPPPHTSPDPRLSLHTIKGKFLNRLAEFEIVNENDARSTGDQEYGAPTFSECRSSCGWWHRCASSSCGATSMPAACLAVALNAGCRCPRACPCNRTPRSGVHCGQPVCRVWPGPGDGKPECRRAVRHLELGC